MDHPVHHQVSPVGIDELHALFWEYGIPLAAAACRKALSEWGGNASDITHIVSMTCTDSANPGYDYALVEMLGIRTNVDKVMLSGVGCSGGLATLRTAVTLAKGCSFDGKPARILCAALEVTSVLARSELHSVIDNDEVRIGISLFGDGAAAAVVSNGVDVRPEEDKAGVYDIVDFKHDMIPSSRSAIGFDVHPHGWKVVLTPEVPTLIGGNIRSLFNSFSACDRAKASAKTCFIDVNMPPTLDDATATSPTDFDWALHPGGRAILTSVKNALGLTSDHLQASNIIYEQHGNASSATNLTVLDELRRTPSGRRDVLAVAFGPGISVEMAHLRRIDLAVDPS